jgi:pimeloyl-ACP methyl ester carboxylesterase
LAPKQKGVTGVIIFVHGVFSDADAAWRIDSKHDSWPELLAKDSDFASDDVYSVGYPTDHFRSTSNIEETAQRVYRQLYDFGMMKYERVYFIAHSMGGLVVKRVLNRLNTPEGVTDLRRVRAVLLISTPSQGAPLADIGKWLSMNPQLKDMVPADFNTFLQSLENDWIEMLLEREHLHQTYPQVFCAYETQRTGTFLIAGRVYTTTRCDEIPYPMNFNHLQIVKPRDVNHDPYTWAKARLQEADKAGTVTTPP